MSKICRFFLMKYKRWTLPFSLQIYTTSLKSKSFKPTFAEKRSFNTIYMSILAIFVFHCNFELQKGKNIKCCLKTCDLFTNNQKRTRNVSIKWKLYHSSRYKMQVEINFSKVQSSSICSGSSQTGRDRKMAKETFIFHYFLAYCYRSNTANPKLRKLDYFNS